MAGAWWCRRRGVSRRAAASRGWTSAAWTRPGCGGWSGEQAAAARARLDAGAGVLVQVVWLDAGPGGQQRVLWVVHHLAVDGVSWRIIVSDLNAAWDSVAGAAAAGGVPALPAVPASFRGWARYLAGEAGDLAHTALLPWWREVLATPDPLLGRRALDPGVDTAATGRSLTRVLAGQWTVPVLTSVPAAFHARVNDVLLTALAVAVSRWRDERGTGAGSAVLVDLEGHGRYSDGGDLSRTVGWFTAVYPVRLDPGALSWDEVTAGEPAVGRAVKLVKEQLRGVPGDGLGYGLLRYLNPRTAPVLAAAAEPQIGFNYLGRFGCESDTGGGSAASWALAAGTGLGGGRDPEMSALHALEVSAVTLDTPGGPELSVTWSWPDGLFDRDDIGRLADLWFTALQALAAHAGRPGAGGRTPSDLTLPGLAQADIDGLEAGVPLADVWPLFPLQEGLLFHALYDGSSADVYTAQFVLALDGPLDAGLLRACAGVLLGRHPGLRAGFQQVGDGTAAQVIWREVPLRWREVDLSGVPEAGQGGAVRDVLDGERVAGFDMARPPLVRFVLARLGGDRHRLVVTGHHIVWDGWSVPVLTGELAGLYRAGGQEKGLPPAAPIRRYLDWLASWDRAAAEAAWAGALAGLQEPTLVAPQAAGRGADIPGSVRRELPQELTAALGAAARRAGVTLNTLVQAAWALYLSRVTGQHDVVFGATVSGRPRRPGRRADGGPVHQHGPGPGPGPRGRDAGRAAGPGPGRAG